MHAQGCHFVFKNTFQRSGNLIHLLRSLYSTVEQMWDRNFCNSQIKKMFCNVLTFLFYYNTLITIIEEKIYGKIVINYKIHLHNFSERKIKSCT